MEDSAKRDLDLQKHLTNGKNPRGIPTVVFIVSSRGDVALYTVDQ